MFRAEKLSVAKKRFANALKILSASAQHLQLDNSRSSFLTRNISEEELPKGDAEPMRDRARHSVRAADFSAHTSIANRKS
jgi:hypothetical protein